MTESNQILSCLFSVNTLADLFEVDRRTVKKRLLAADIAPEGERNGCPVYRLKTVAAYLAPPRPSLSDGTIDPSKLAPREFAYWEQALHTRRRREQLEGALIWAEDCRFQMGEIAKIAVAGFSTLPDVLERDADLTAEQYEVIERVINGVREAIATRIEQDSSQPEDDTFHEVSSRN